jgi:hypothetical protein
MVMDLKRRPALMEDKDLSEIKRIYWIDSNPTSVNDVMQTLGIPARPSRFVAFMPEQLEKKLFEMEKAAMMRQAGKYDEDRIKETVFRVLPLPGGGYVPQLVDLQLK